ncbi:unnamed protein product, partial [marine sediment metagenome]
SLVPLKFGALVPLHYGVLVPLHYGVLALRVTTPGTGGTFFDALSRANLIAVSIDSPTARPALPDI